METFENWLEKVDDKIQAICGLSLYDLVDCAYHDWYDCGMTPREAAHEALENESFPFGEWVCE